jgi:hypothetical protein
MQSPLLALGAALGLVLHRLRAGYRAGRIYRGTRVVTCPDSLEPAAVELDRRRAAFTAFLGRPWVSVRRCSRWPARWLCSRECLTGIQATPQEGIVRTLVARWAAGRSCALCGCSLGGTRQDGYAPALLGLDGTTIESQDLPPESLPEQLRAHQPVCWYCHVASKLRRERPDLFPRTQPPTG